MDNILAIKRELVARVRECRREKGLSQQKLAECSGVSFGSVKRFERFGEISLVSLLRLAMALNCAKDFAGLFREDLPAASIPAVQPRESALFTNKKIRKVFCEGDWWFCLTDIITTVTGSRRPRHYLLDIRRRDHALARLWPRLTRLLPLSTSQGQRELLCITALGFFRLVQSMPNKQAEIWRLWLAQTGREHFRKSKASELSADLSAELHRLSQPVWS